MTPQEAVDLVTTSRHVNTVNHGDQWVEVYGLFWAISITKQGIGVAQLWPSGSNMETARLDGTIRSCELSTLECSRIMNEVNRRLIS